MRKPNKTLIVIFFVLGILTLYMGLSVDLKCAEATAWDNFLAGLPLWLFGVYCFITSLFLWKKPQIGNILAVISFTIAAVLLIASIFDLHVPVIKVPNACLIQQT